MGESKKRDKPLKPLVRYGCQQPGHFRRECPNKKSLHKADTAKEEPVSQGGSALTVGKGCSQSGRWLVDSGASCHMTWDKELLTDCREIDSSQPG